MPIVLDKDCITRPDGSKLCYDIEQEKFILFSKTEVTGDELSKAEMTELIKIVAKNKQK